MAVYLSIGRIRSVPLAVSLVALVGLAVVAGAVYFPIHPGPEVEPGLQVKTVPGPGSAAVAPRPSGDGRRAAEARADSRVEAKAGHDAEPAGPPEPRAPAEPPAEPPKAVAPASAAAEVEPASAVAKSVSGTAKAPAKGETETALIREVAVSIRSVMAPETARIATAGAVDAGSAAGASENRAGPAGPRAAASQPLAPRERVAVARRVVEPRDLVASPTRVAPRNPVETGSRPQNLAPIPVRAPRRADAGTMARSARTMFERGAKIKLNKDASVYITARNIPENDRLLEAYSADRAAEGSSAPGLLGIATQAYRTQAAAGTANKTYSLADAMRDAVWRKKTAAKLKTLMTARNACPEAEEDSGASKPSIGLGNTC